MTTYLIFNSHSGSYNRHLKNIVEKKLKLLYDNVSCIDLYKNDFTDLKNDCGIVCIAGGDGTINNTVSAIIKNNLQSQVKVILIPFGSANVLTNSLGIRQSFVLKNWNKLSIKEIEIGKVNNNIFLTATSLGMISKIINKTNHLHKNILGFAGYLLNILIHWRINNHEFTINIDGKDFQTTANSVSISIGLNVAGFSPKLKKPDGLIDLYILKNKTPLGYLGVLKQFIFNGTGKYLEKYSGAKVSCSVKEKLDLQIDGEKHKSTDLISAEILGTIKVLL